MKKILLTAWVLVTFLSCKSETSNSQTINRKNTEITKKVEDLISKMTLDEKIAEMTQDAPANDRLGIPFMKYGEALHGLWLVLDYYGNTTVYPQAIACGSTWEPELIRKMASQTALEEGDSKDVDLWKDSKFGAAKWDSVNKNLRELIVISTLIMSLMISYHLNVLTGMDSLFIVVIFLRGLQQLFTGYIMSQQLSSLKSFLIKGLTI